MYWLDVSCVIEWSEGDVLVGAANMGASLIFSSWAGLITLVAYRLAEAQKAEREAAYE